MLVESLLLVDAIVFIMGHRMIEGMKHNAEGWMNEVRSEQRGSSSTIFTQLRIVKDGQLCFQNLILNHFQN